MRHGNLPCTKSFHAWEMLVPKMEHVASASSHDMTILSVRCRCHYAAASGMSSRAQVKELTTGSPAAHWSLCIPTELVRSFTPFRMTTYHLPRAWDTRGRVLSFDADVYSGRAVTRTARTIEVNRPTFIGRVPTPLCRGCSRFFLRLLVGAGGLFVFPFRFAGFLFRGLIGLLIDEQNGIHPFQICDRSRVALALPKFDDAGVTSIAIGRARRDFIKQLFHRVLLPQHRERGAPGVD